MSVNITLGSGNTGGIIATNDGTCVQVLTGTTEGNVVAGTPFLVSNPAEIEALALTEATNPLAVKFFNEFVLETARQGVNQFKLYMLFVSDAMKVTQICDVTDPDGAKKAIDYAAGEARFVGVMTDDAAVYPGGAGFTDVGGINDDCYDAVDNLHTLCVSYSTAQSPLVGIVAGTSFNDTVADLIDQTQSTNKHAGIFIGDTESGAGCTMGTLMGRLAAIPVQRKISRVRSGTIASSTAFIGTTSVDQMAGIQTIKDRGFITFTFYPRKNGFYFANSPTSTATTDSYCTLERNRVVNKAWIIVYDTLIEEVDEEIIVNADGTIEETQAKSIEQAVINNININMLANKNISDEPTVYIDRAHNIKADNTMPVTVTLDGVAYATTIPVKLVLA